MGTGPHPDNLPNIIGVSFGSGVGLPINFTLKEESSLPTPLWDDPPWTVRLDHGRANPFVHVSRGQVDTLVLNRWLPHGRWPKSVLSRNSCRTTLKEKLTIHISEVLKDACYIFDGTYFRNIQRCMLCFYGKYFRYFRNTQRCMLYFLHGTYFRNIQRYMWFILRHIFQNYSKMQHISDIFTDACFIIYGTYVKNIQRCMLCYLWHICQKYSKMHVILFMAHISEIFNDACCFQWHICQKYSKMHVILLMAHISDIFKDRKDACIFIHGTLFLEQTEGIWSVLNTIFGITKNWLNHFPAKRIIINKSWGFIG